MASVVCFKPQRAAHTFNRSLLCYRESDTGTAVLIVVSGTFFPMWWCHCVSKPSLQGAHTPNESLHRYCSYTSVISRSSFNCASFIFSHLVQVLSQYLRRVWPSSAPLFYPVHLSWSCNIYFSAVYQMCSLCAHHWCFAWHKETIWRYWV